MFKNFFKSAVRGLRNNRVHSFINIAGLSVGMGVAMLIGLWVWDELSFNTYHENYGRIVEVMQKEKFLGGTKVWNHLPYPLISELKTNYKNEFSHVVAAISTDGYSLSVNEKKLPAAGLFIDADAPEMLTLKMLNGSRAGLTDPKGILLSSAAARALFGDADPIGKTVRLPNDWNADGTLNQTVTGVYASLPPSSSFNEVQYFLPWHAYVTNNSGLANFGWDDHRFTIYAQLPSGADEAVIDKRVSTAEMNVIAHLSNMKPEVAANPTLFLHPMRRWHLYSDFKEGVADEGAAQFVWLVGIIGGFVLLLACINFMNLSTARSEKRAKEVGIRKTIGSMRVQLIAQFLAESILLSAVALGLALILVSVSLPFFNILASKQLVLPWTNPFFWAASLLFMLATGLLAGSYPALYLSSFRPVKVLKGTFRMGRSAAIPRKALVVVQFSISVCLIIATIVVYKQVLFAKDRPVGYSRNGLLMLPVNGPELQGKFDLLAREMKNAGAISAIAESESPLTDVSSHNGGFVWKGKPAGLEEDFGTLTVSYDYGKTIGWDFLAGRDFSPAFNTDSSAFVINETAARFMGLQHPVGETIHWTSKWMGFDRNFTVIGVIRDMVMQSPYEPVKPTVFRLGGNVNWMYARIHPAMGVSAALTAIEGVYKRLAPNTVFEYHFADEAFARKFATEVRIGRLAGLFAVLAVFISCLGLFGMATFVAEQRTKEIGVRKVLGATVVNLWGLLSREFLGLVLLSICIAAPAAYFFMHSWLQRYSYRTGIPWYIFALAGGGALVITLVTVSYQSIRAALANPVKSLRSE